jgi:hypothetical protein
MPLIIRAWAALTRPNNKTRGGTLASYIHPLRVTDYNRRYYSEPYFPIRKESQRKSCICAIP